MCQIIEKSIKLNFEKYISNICKKASNQLNAICRLQTFMGHKEKEAMINIAYDKYFRAFKFQLWTWHVSSVRLLEIPERKQASPLPCWKFCKIV